MSKALSAASRGVASWVDVPYPGWFPDLSPLAWSIKSGALHAASTTLTDLLTFSCRSGLEMAWTFVRGLRAAHVWTQRNRVCDELSRLRSGQRPKLPELSKAYCMKRRLPEGAILRSLKLE